MPTSSPPPARTRSRRAGRAGAVRRWSSPSWTGCARGWACRRAPEGVRVAGAPVGNLTALAAAAHGRAGADRSPASPATPPGAWARLPHRARLEGPRLRSPAYLRVLDDDGAGRLAAPRGGRRGHRVPRPAGGASIPSALVATAGTTSTGSGGRARGPGRTIAAARVCGCMSTAPTARRRGCVTPAESTLLTASSWRNCLVLYLPSLPFQPYEMGCVLVASCRAAGGGLLARRRVPARHGRRGAVDLRNRSLQLSRGSRALKLWLSLQVFGLDAFRDAIAHRTCPRRARRVGAQSAARLLGDHVARSARDRLLSPRRRRRRGRRARPDQRRAGPGSPSRTATPPPAPRCSEAAPPRSGCARSTRAPRSS